MMPIDLRSPWLVKPGTYSEAVDRELERQVQTQARNESEETMTIGEDRVRIKFNPSASNLVDDIKQRSAALIDMCEAHKEVRVQPAPLTDVQGEVNRLWALAQTHFEDAAMWATKAATYPKD